MGKKLLKQLKVRNSIKKDIFENQKRGKLNSKKLFQALYNEDLFYRVEKEDFKNVFEQTTATAALAASIFHFNEIPITELKTYLTKQQMIFCMNRMLK